MLVYVHARVYIYVGVLCVQVYMRPHTTHVCMCARAHVHVYVRA